MVPGEVVAGKYQVERVLGRGGMGEVVVARHALLGERVAIKSLLAEATTDRETVERFLNEARASLRIRSEHVVRVSDVDLLPDGRPFMVMELLEGRDLEARMQEGAFGVEEAVDLLLQACEGVAEAHRIGIVHRDLKPGNMFLTRRSDGSTRVVLLDFGISKFVENAGQGFTSTTGLMGSPSYMSPEQFQNPRDVDARTDVWALGVILFRMLAGRAPFVAFSVPALVVQVLREEPPRLRSLRPDVPPLLEALVAQCLQKPREARVESVAALAKGLAPFASRDGSRAIERLQRFSAPQGAMAETRPVLQALPTASEPTAPRVLEPTAPLPTPTREEPTLAPTAQRVAPSRRGLWVGLSLTALVIVVVAIGVGLSSSGASPAPAGSVVDTVEIPSKPRPAPSPVVATPSPSPSPSSPPVLAPKPKPTAPASTAPLTPTPAPKPSSTITDDI